MTFEKKLISLSPPNHHLQFIDRCFEHVCIPSVILIAKDLLRLVPIVHCCQVVCSQLNFYSVNVDYERDHLPVSTVYSSQKKTGISFIRDSIDFK